MPGEEAIIFRADAGKKTNSVSGKLEETYLV